MTAFVGVGCGACCCRLMAETEQRPEGVTKLGGHRRVDEKVERIRQQDDEIEEERNEGTSRRILNRFLDDLMIHH